MRMQDLTASDEVFTSIGRDKRQTSYAVSKLYEHCVEEGLPISEIPVEPEQAIYAIDARGIEKSRLSALLDPLHAEWAIKPILLVHAPDDEWLMVDGSHRFVAAAVRGQPTIRCYKVPWVIAVQFVIEDAPQTDESVLLSSDSGLDWIRRTF